MFVPLIYVAGNNRNDIFKLTQLTLRLGILFARFHAVQDHKLVDNVCLIHQLHPENPLGMRQDVSDNLTEPDITRNSPVVSTNYTSTRQNLALPHVGIYRGIFQHIHFRKFEDNCVVFLVYFPLSQHTILEDLMSVIIDSDNGFTEGRGMFLVKMFASSFHDEEDPMEDFSLVESQFVEKLRLGIDANSSFLITVPLLFVTSEKWSLYCYLCPQDNRLSWQSLSNFPSSYMSLKESLAKLLSNGHESNANVYSATFGEAEGVEKLECISETLNKKPPACHTSIIILGVMAKHINVTLKPMTEPEEDEMPESPGLHLCLVCSIYTYNKTMKYFNPHLFRDKESSFRYIYCGYNAELQTRLQFNFLSRPFDSYVWVCIGVVSIAVAILQRDVAYGLDIIWSLLNQPYQKTHNLSFIMAAAFLVLIVLTNGYSGVLTSHITKPPVEKQMRDLDEMIHEKNFTYLVGNSIQIPYMIDKLVNAVPKYKGKVRPEHYKVVKVPGGNVLEYAQTNTLNFFKLLADHNGGGVIPKGSFDAFIVDGFQIRLGAFTCSCLKEELPNVKLNWVLRLHLSGVAYRTLKIIYSSGIHEFWRLVRVRNEVNSFITANSVNSSRKVLLGFREPKAFSIFSSFSLSFYLLGIGIGFSVS